MDFVKKIKDNPLDKKWLIYAFKRLTGMSCDDVDIIVTYLRNVRGYSDDFIERLINSTYGPNGYISVPT